MSSPASSPAGNPTHAPAGGRASPKHNALAALPRIPPSSPLAVLTKVDPLWVIGAVLVFAIVWRFGREWFQNLMQRAAAARGDLAPQAEQVEIRLKLSDDARGAPEERARLHEAHTLIEQLLESTRTGEVEEAAFGRGYWTWVIAGPSADAIFDMVSPAIAHFEPRAGSQAVLRYGGEGAEEATVELAGT
ncbi:MAG: hypothetical protein JSR45_03595 [Proteobacteria bacterium]|nr:hypothetical protein [Pseudomonadota bacterium]